MVCSLLYNIHTYVHTYKVYACGVLTNAHARTCVHQCRPCSTYVHMCTYVCTPQASTTAVLKGSTGRCHSLYGQSQLGVLRVVDHVWLHLNLTWQTIEIVSELAFGLVIVPLVLKPYQGAQRERVKQLMCILDI